MTHLERMPVRYASPASCVHERSAFEPVVVRARDALAADRVAREHAHELIKPLCLEAICRRQLPEKGTCLRSECEHAAGEEIPERTLAIAQLEIVRDEPPTLDGEDEAAIGHCFGPAREHGR